MGNGHAGFPGGFGLPLPAQPQPMLQVATPINDVQMVALMATMLWKDAERRVGDATDAPSSDVPGVEVVAQQAVRMAAALLLETVVQVTDNNALLKGLEMKRKALELSREGARRT